MQISNNEDFLLALKFYEEGKYGDALQIINNLEQKRDLTHYDRILCDLLKGSVMVRSGQYNEALTLAERISQESQKTGRELQLVDAFILKARALYWLRRLDEELNVLEQAENLLKILIDKPSLEIKKREAWIAWGRGVIYWDKGKPDLQIKYLEQGLVLGEETGNKEIIFLCLMLQGYYYTSQCQFNQALSYINRSLEIAKLMKNQPNTAWVYGNLAWICYEKGELDNSIKYIRKAYRLYKKTNNKLHCSSALHNLGMIYMQRGEFHRAFGYLERSLALFENIGDHLAICGVLDDLIILTLEMSDFNQSHVYLNHLKEINETENNQVLINLLYRFDKALILKKDPHVFNLTEAKNLLEQIIHGEIIDYQIHLAALLELCDLLLIDLKDTNDLKLLDMIQPHINKIIEIAKQKHSYWLLAEIHILQAKLELITLDLNETQRSLTKAYHIAEKYGLNLLVSRILNQQDELQKELIKWENFKNSKAIMAERIELARIEEQLVQMLRKRLSLEKVIF